MYQTAYTSCRGCCVCLCGRWSPLPANREYFVWLTARKKLIGSKIVHGLDFDSAWDVRCFLPQGSEFGGDGFTDYQDSVVSERQKVRALTAKSKHRKHRRRNEDTRLPLILSCRPKVVVRMLLLPIYYVCTRCATQG